MYDENRTTHNWLIKKLVNEKLRRQMPDFTGSVLDLGCGVRPFEHDILQYADRYIGVDCHTTLPALPPDVVADLTRALPVRSAVFDHVVAFEVMEHLAEPGVMLAEAHRVLRPGGSLTVSVPFQWWVHEAPWDFYRYTRHGLEYLLRKAGFVDIRIEPTSGFWSMWFLKLNYQTARLVRGPRPLRWVIRAVLIPFWWLNQTLAPLLDRVWAAEEETAGYFVKSIKP